MMKNKAIRICVYGFVSLLFNNAALAQSHQEGGAVDGVEEITPLMVGQRVPEEFWTREHLFYVNGDTVRRTLEEYKGKMLVLGFWATWCASCLYNTDKIESFTKRYPDEIVVVKVNSMDTRDDIDRIETVLSGNVGASSNIDLANFSSVVYDKYLRGKFPAHGFPGYVWINKAGYFQTITYRNLLDENYIAPFID